VHPLVLDESNDGATLSFKLLTSVLACLVQKPVSG
jgi:hypothetical protein